MLPSLGEASGFFDDYACKIILLYMEPCWDTCVKWGSCPSEENFLFSFRCRISQGFFFLLLLIDGPIQEKFINDLFFPSKIGGKKETLTLLSPKGKNL